MATYLDVVNNVLTRLREPSVTDVNSNLLSKLIGTFVNDAKREVEDAYNWNALSSTVTINTVNDIYNYTLTGSRTRFKVIDILNDTENCFMEYRPTSWFNSVMLLESAEKGAPRYFNFNGVDVNGDTQVDVFPIPDQVYTLRFNLTIPQADLVSNTTRILVPDHLVAQLAYSKAAAERGEDAGVTSAEAYSLYRNSLADAIAIESNHYEEEVNWVAP
jgi:hypothetical protein